MSSARRMVNATATALVLTAGAAAAQIAPERTLDELKLEVQARADRNAYPVSGLKPADVREALAAIRSLDRDEWAAAWSTIGDRYMAAAKQQEAGDKAAAAKTYLQAWEYYQFGRFPVENSPGKKRAYARALEAFAQYGRLVDPPIETVRISFDGKEIVGYLRLPKDVRPAPIVFAVSALDGRKEGHAARAERFLPHGIGLFAIDMPGTGQAPVIIDDKADRMLIAALDHVRGRADVDGARIVVQGGSWSGYWSARLAHIAADRIKGAVVQGAPIHGYFQPEWQRKALGTREYLFDLFPARASVYGADTLEEFLAYGPTLSLLTEGLLDKPSAPMIVINGRRDTQVPIEDLELLLKHGSPKEAWVNPEGGHMGRGRGWSDEQIFERVVLPWIVRRIKG